jgi:hypothetical protein
MKTVYTVKIARPPEVSEEDPCPIALNNTFSLDCAVKWQDGRPVNLTGAKIVVSIKAALADLDAAAKFTKNSTSHASYFSVTNATGGLFTFTAPAGDLVTATLTKDTNYYLDIQIILSGGAVHTFLYDTIRPFQTVTIATT